MKRVNSLIFLAVIQCVKTTHGNVSVDLAFRPVIFGKTAQLLCTAVNTTLPLDKPYTRTWTGGPAATLLCRNGISVDSSEKYKEVRKNNSSYILEINNFTEADVDVDYGCNFGVDTGRMTLSLNEHNYEFHPKRNMIVIHSTLRNGRFKVSIDFTKVFPVPVCNISFEDIELGKKIIPSKEENGKLYSVNMKMSHQFGPDICSGEVVINCRIGTKHMEVHRKSFDTCHVKVHTPEKKLMSDAAIGTVIAAVTMILVLLAIITIKLLLKKK